MTDWRFWIYQARLKRVVDGDTMDMELDLGFHTHHFPRIRLKDIDTAEVHGVKHSSEEYATGQTHSKFVKAWFLMGEYGWTGDWPFVIQTEKDRQGKHGRYIATVTRKSDKEELTGKLALEFPETDEDE